METLVSEPLAAEPIVTKKTTATRPKSTLNIQQILSGKVDSEDVKLKPENGDRLGNRKLELEEVRNAWTLFAETRKNQVAEFNLLQRDFSLKDNRIQLQLTNPVEEPLLAGIKSDLVAFLKEKLNNEIFIDGVLIKADSKKMIYTNKDKFDHLAEKNPILHELKDRLGLDTDY